MLNGDGLRVVLWVAGCSHCCRECQNPITWDPNGGLPFTEAEENEIFAELDKDYISGITFSGGDPMYQPLACSEIAQYAKSLGLTVWCYTGDMFEEVLQNQAKCDFLNYIDVLVDDKFDISQRSLDLQFKGSKNQRIIDVPKSLKMGSIVLKQEYEMPKNYRNLYQKPDYMFI